MYVRGAVTPNTVFNHVCLIQHAVKNKRVLQQIITSMFGTICLEEKNTHKDKHCMFSSTIRNKELLQRSSHLSIGLLRLLPADHHCVLWNNVGLDVSWRTGRSLLSCAGLHPSRRRPLADAIEGRHSDFVLRVGVQAPDAVAGGGDAVHRLELAVRPFGSVLDDVVGDGVWVAGVPGDGHTGCGGLRDDGCARRLWQSWRLDRGEESYCLVWNIDHSVHSVPTTVALMTYCDCKLNIFYIFTLSSLSTILCYEQTHLLKLPCSGLWVTRLQEGSTGDPFL